MNYMIFDLEFNQGFHYKKENYTTINLECPFEIIDIGAIKLDEEFNVIDTFNSLIKPSIYKRLHPYVKKITGISKEKLKLAPTINELYVQFMEFINDVDVLCVWGSADIKELIRNIEYHKLDSSIVPTKYIDVQQHASKFLNSKNGNSIGLENAAKLLNITIDNQFHMAYNDAFYTAEVFKLIFNEDINPELFIYSKETKKNKNSTANELDDNCLFAQFEKMYNREITLEEKLMIKLAYKMGSTNQFKKQV